MTSKRVGDTMEAGEYLGAPGSSGPSGGPQLRFEIHDSADNLIDPYEGPCNALNEESWWLSQRPYLDSTINKVCAGAAPPIFPECPEPEIPNEPTVFSPGDIIHFVTYCRDQLASQQSQYTIYKPDGSPHRSWSHSSEEPYYQASWWDWAWEFENSDPTGTWRFEAIYEAEVCETTFVLTVLDNQVFLPIVVR